MSTNTLILNGPNLNQLGLREPEIYGRETLSDVEARCKTAAKRLGLRLECRQSNHEGQLVDWIQEAREKFDAIIINAGAYTHTSIAIHDALRAYEGWIVELHISNPHARETFRHQSYIAPLADVVIAGFGTAGYVAALEALAASPGTQPGDT